MLTALATLAPACPPAKSCAAYALDSWTPGAGLLLVIIIFIAAALLSRVGRRR